MGFKWMQVARSVTLADELAIQNIYIAMGTRCSLAVTLMGPLGLTGIGAYRRYIYIEKKLVPG